MKKLLILAVSLVVSGLVFAHGSGRGPWSSDSTDNRQQMDQWHNVMHGIAVGSKNLEKGVQLNITAESDEILGTLKKDLKIHKKGLSEFFKGVEVAVAESEKGFEISLTSEDNRIVNRLQNWKNGLFYQFVQNQMHGQLGGRMGYGDHMGGYGDRRGGCEGQGRGYGPGMMRGSYNNHMDDYNSYMMGPGQPTM